MRFNRFNLLLVATAIITSMSGCTGSQKRTTQQEKESATMATTTVNTKNKNFYGTYEGTLPCADCSGIRTTLKINSDTQPTNCGVNIWEGRMASLKKVAFITLWVKTS